MIAGGGCGTQAMSFPLSVFPHVVRSRLKVKKVNNGKSPSCVSNALLTLDHLLSFIFLANSSSVGSMSSKPSGGRFVLCVLIFGIVKEQGCGTGFGKKKKACVCK